MNASGASPPDGGLEFPWADPPGVGRRIAVREGLDWIRQPLPFRLDHVNCWWLDAGASASTTGPGVVAGRVLVDTCIAGRTSRANWEAALGDAIPDALLVTHFHPDHSGLAGHFHERGARLLGGEVEMHLSARLRAADPDAYAAVYGRWYRANGLSEDAVAAVRAQGNGYRGITDARPPMEAWTWLDAGDRVRLGGRDWTVRIGRGHAPRMLMLHCAEDHLLIAADQVLPSISPNVSLFPNVVDGEADARGDDREGEGADAFDAGALFGVRDDDPLGSFLDCLEALRDLPADTLVLPSHGRPFLGLHARLDALVAHHEERLDRVREACAEPASAADLFDVLFGRKLDGQQMSFALGEALAHVRRLERLGEVVGEAGADGVRRYRTRR